MDDDLEARLKAAAEAVRRMTPAEREEMHRQQRESWVRGEMGWPKPRYRVVNGGKVYDSYADYCAD